MRATQATFRFMVLATVFAAVAVASAHIVEVTGTITERQGSRLEVQTATGAMTITVETSTPVMRDKKQVDISELKTGVRVEIQALDDTDTELVAFLVTILPAK